MCVSACAAFRCFEASIPVALSHFVFQTSRTMVLILEGPHLYLKAILDAKDFIRGVVIFEFDAARSSNFVLQLHQSS
jgi:hypothetical protein